ncbi:glutaredoxin domain-containing protein [Aromatoleum toluclasticum]|uniref:glutaredoxin domain-containing protein n=1 Tax=Aromatoleum toluclasticum TaxID=92003 RepID=UPI0003805CF7|nr:glutaredoxin domain-containing protein [Aromatoleum toluclasticum]
MIRVEIFSTPGCDRCARARQTLKAVAERLEAVSWREVDVLSELDYAVELGVLTPPAIAIDGVLVFPSLRAPERLLAELRRRLERADNGGSPL